MNYKADDGIIRVVCVRGYEEIRIQMIKMSEKSNQMNFVDLFAGIGGIKLGFEKNGFKAVFSNDFDVYCKTTFDYNFSEIFQQETELYLKDITQVPSKILPEFNLLTGGFPCQPFSIAGYRKGFTDKYYYNGKSLFEKLKNDVTKRDTVYQWCRKYVRENKSNVCPTLTNRKYGN